MSLALVRSLVVTVRTRAAFGLALSLLLIDSSHAGTFARSYSSAASESFTAVSSSPSGDLYAAGSTDGVGRGIDAWVTRLDKRGQVIWQKAIGGAGEDRASAIDAADDGGACVAGLTRSEGGGGSDLWVVRFGASGSIKWQVALGGAGDEEAASVRSTDDGGCVVLGHRYSPSFTRARLWVVRLDSLGTVVWERTYDQNRFDKGGALRLAASGEIAVAAYQEKVFSSQQTSAYLLNLSSNGAIRWQREYTTGAFGYSVRDLRLTSDGGYVVAGRENTFEDGDLWLMKTDSTGVPSWRSLLRANRFVGAVGVAQLETGSFVVSGEFQSGVGFNSTLMAGFDSTGSLVWQTIFDRGQLAGRVAAGGLDRATRSELVVAGGDSDGLVLRTTSEGQLDLSCNLSSPFNARRLNGGGGLATPGFVAAPSLPTVTITTAIALNTSATPQTPCIDSDGDQVTDTQDNCPTTPNPGQEDTDGDLIGDVCDGCPLIADPVQEDIDHDGRGDVCDNCLTTRNESQHDLDNDGQGDECDHDDGVILFSGITHPVVTWQSDPAFSQYNLYRGSLSELLISGVYTQPPGSNPYAAQFCRLATTAFSDGTIPSSSTALYWLVTGVGVGGEAALSAGDTVSRENTNPCP